MKQIAILAAAMSLLPLAAAAQVEPIQRGPAPPATQNRGITVSGSAVTRVPATQARVTLNVVSADRSLILDKAKVSPIVDALVKAGADPSSVHLPINFGAPGASNMASITATVMHPTVQGMEDGIQSVGATIAGMKGVILSGAQVYLIADGCRTALDAARREAIDQARGKADSIANDLNVHVGPAVNVIAYEQNTPDGSCSTQYFVGGTMNGPQEPQKPSDYVTVPATSSVTITYAIR